MKKLLRSVRITLPLVLFWIGIVYAHAGESESSFFTFQDHSCDNSNIHLTCPQGTSIVIVLARYGRLPSSAKICQETKHNRMIQKSFTSTAPSIETRCATLDADQVNIVARECQAQRRCQILVTPSMFDGGSCPGYNRSLQVGYQCHSNEYLTRSACRGSVLDLVCSKPKRLIIRSAQYGFIHPGQRECFESARNMSLRDCSSSCAQLVVTDLCHAKLSCSIWANEDALRSSCHPHSLEYLTLVYACVPRRLLKKRSEMITVGSTCNSTIRSNNLVWNSTSQATILFKSIDDPVPTTPAQDFLQQLAAERILGNFILTWRYILDNCEKMILYGTVGFCSGFILFLLVIVFRLSLFVRRMRRRTQLLTQEQTGGFTHPILRQRLKSCEERAPSGGWTYHEEWRKTFQHMAFAGTSPTLPSWDTPVFVHVESPHESPLLGHAPIQTPTESPVWIRRSNLALSQVQSGIRSSVPGTRISVPESSTSELVWQQNAASIAGQSITSGIPSPSGFSDPSGSSEPSELATGHPHSFEQTLQARPVLRTFGLVGVYGRTPVSTEQSDTLNSHALAHHTESADVPTSSSSVPQYELTARHSIGYFTPQGPNPLNGALEAIERARSLSRSYTNPFRHDSFGSDRRNFRSHRQLPKLE